MATTVHTSHDLSWEKENNVLDQPSSLEKLFILLLPQSRICGRRVLPFTVLVYLEEHIADVLASYRERSKAMNVNSRYGYEKG